jgi:hypothetical protein
MLTLAQVKSSSVASVAGVNVGDPQFVQYVNDAVRQLIELGNGGSRGWWGTVRSIQGTAYDGCFVWPANVIAVLGMSTVHGGKVELANQWYSFVPEGIQHRRWARQWNGSTVAEFDGQTCLFRSIAANPTKIKVLSNSASDVGVTITIYGVDNLGNTVFESVAVGGTTVNAFSQVTDVAKAKTFGQMSLYATTGANVGDLLASYQGGDINPKFLYSRLSGATVWLPVTALVKIGFSEVSADTDIIPLDNVDAIKSQVQAIRARESGNNGDPFEKDALRRLVNQVNSRFPLEQFVVSFKPFGKNQNNVISRE